MQASNELEKHYETRDPWKYQSTPDDIKRKEIILAVTGFFTPMHSLPRGGVYRGPFERALDIGAGEGWITAQLPAKSIYGYELSDNAASRFPPNVKRANPPEGMFDLILATGIMYAHYDIYTFLRLIKEHGSNIVLTSNIKDWETSAVKEIGKQIFEAEFPYREFIQKLRVFKL